MGVLFFVLKSFVYLLKILKQIDMTKKQELVHFLKALSLQNVSDCDHWTCEKCGKVPDEQVTYEETHDGCGGHCS